MYRNYNQFPNLNPFDPGKMEDIAADKHQFIGNSNIY